MHQDGLTRAVVIVVLDSLRLTNHCVINFHSFKSAVAVEEAADAKGDVEGVPLCRNSHEVLDEVNKEVFLTCWNTVRANAWRPSPGHTLLLVFIRFGLAIDKALEQVKIAEQGFVANAVSPARLSRAKTCPLGCSRAACSALPSQHSA